MRIAVCLKQVPDSEARLRVAGDGRWIEEEDVSFKINESDEYALEQALQMAEAGDGEVVVFSLGPDRVRESLRKALALGAASAVHLADDAFHAGDALATGRALAAAISKESFDLVLTGSQSDDLGAASTGTVVAGELGWPHAWLVMGVEIEEGGSLKVVREMESGLNEVLRLRMPAVIEVQAGINHPRYASLKGIMAAKRKPITAPTPDEIGLSAGQVGLEGSRTEMVSVALPDEGEGAQIFEGDPQTAAATLVDRLRKEAKVLT
jgi:electron transfer flavoprotein beta subunit